jgi:bifunctional enzyme CysN/CysC
VNRPNLDFRGFSGVVAGGTVRKGDKVKALPSGKESTVASIVLDGEIDQAVSGQSVTITLADEIDVSRGDILSAAGSPPGVSDQFEATIVWMNETAMLPHRPYLLKVGARTVTANISAIKHKVNVNTLEHLAAKGLELNEIGVCNISLEQMIAFDPYAENKDTGGFILIDRMTNETVGAGMIHFALRRAQNIHWQAVDVHKEARAAQKSQKSCVLWFTGLSGAGKSTIANLVEKKLYAINRHTYLLDGDNVRHGLNRDLGFTDVDRVENIRRVGEVAKLMVDSGLIVLTAFISPFRAERQMVRSLLEGGEFFEVYIETPLAVAESRDVKGLYKKARAGQIKNFTGIDSPYEAPETPDIRVDTTRMSAEEAADYIVKVLEDRGMLTGGTF